MKNRFTIKSLVFISVLILLFCTELVHNVGRLIISRGYFIPNESSIFTFSPILENVGSGEWWIYGEDNNNYYYAAVTPYIIIKKNNQCINFDKLNYRTWCGVDIPIHDGIPD
ncbi:MAG: hypothetical protein LBL45_00140 [Treponema sp.]|jgi:hypothetical protein|nr:hypothetical protein [Treponema sp.]